MSPEIDTLLSNPLSVPIPSALIGMCHFCQLQKTVSPPKAPCSIS